MGHARIAVLALGLLAVGSPAEAQVNSPRPNGDAAVAVGWLGVRDQRPSRYSRRWANSLYGQASAGWYWTEHLKTEVDVGAGTEGRVYLSHPLHIDGREVWQHIDARFSRRTLGVSQQYQYGRNAWFHPYLGAGVHLTWERRTERHAPLAIYGPTPPPQTVREGFTDGPATRVTARPFVATGFKGYLTPRTFFRSDLRLGFRRTLDETIVRAGFGFDF